MLINVIYDDRINFLDKDRLIHHFNIFNITEFKFWDACINKKNVLENITESFRLIIQYAKDNGLCEVCIAEQDLEFVSTNAWVYFLENKPKDFDVYIGGSYLIDNRWEYKPPLVKVNEWVGNHLIIVNEKYYDKWLASKPDGHIDTEQRGKGEFYVCFPYAALQRPSKSANCNNQMVNYNNIVPKEFIYNI